LKTKPQNVSLVLNNVPLVSTQQKIVHNVLETELLYLLVQFHLQLLNPPKSLITQLDQLKL
jgi:hypothetical protein